MYGYKTDHSLFKLCDVGETLGKDAEKPNFYDAKAANQDCKDMNLYKCVSFCNIAEDCKSAFYFEGPMDSDLKEPRYLCVQFKADLNDKDSFKDDNWGDLAKFKCNGDTCQACTQSDDEVTACMLREFLKTQKDNKLSPLMLKTGSKLVFNQHLGSNILSNIESKYNFGLTLSLFCYDC